jgi:hypothetical protein
MATASVVPLSRFLLPRMVATGSFVGVATAFRLGTSNLGLAVTRTPPLMMLAVKASSRSTDAANAQEAFHDEVVAFARESAEVSWLEVRRGIDQFDALTRPD